MNGTPRTPRTPRRTARRYSARKSPAVRRRATARRATSVRKSRSTGRRKSSGSLHPFLVAQMNPFSPRALGCRVPDQSTAFSGGFHTQDQTFIDNAAAGFASACVFLPNTNTYASNMTPASASTITVPAAFGGYMYPARQTSIASSYALVRPVAHAVRLTTSVAPQNCQGFVHSAVFPMSMFGVSSWEVPLSIASMVDLPGYSRTPLASLIENPLIVVNRFLGPDSFIYSDPTDSQLINQPKAALDSPNGWCVIMIWLTGAYSAAAPSNQLACEAICHFEGIASPGSIGVGGPAEPPNSAVMDVGAAYVAKAPTTRPDAPSGGKPPPVTHLPPDRYAHTEL